MKGVACVVLGMAVALAGCDLYKSKFDRDLDECRQEVLAWGDKSMDLIISGEAQPGYFEDHQPTMNDLPVCWILTHDEDNLTRDEKLKLMRVMREATESMGQRAYERTGDPRLKP